MIKNADKNQKDNSNRPPKNKDSIESFYQYIKKIRNLPKKTIQNQNSSGKQLLNSYSKDRAQFPCSKKFRERSPDGQNSHNCSQNRFNRLNSQNNQYRINYSGSKLKENNCSFYNSNRSYLNPRNRYYPND